MSKFSEELHDGLEAIAKAESSQSLVVNVDGAETLRGVELIDPFQEHYEKHILSQMRKPYRRSVGGRKPTTVQECHDLYTGTMLDYLTPVCMLAFCDGVQIAQQTTPIIRKYQAYKQMDDIFGATAFIDESSRLADQFFVGDGDAHERVRSFLEMSADQFAGLSGFISMPDNNPLLQKIWDVWFYSTKSAAVAFYAAGHLLGKKWQEDEVLTGILAASTSEGEADGGE